jgi:hypothetical protein
MSLLTLPTKVQNWINQAESLIRGYETENEEINQMSSREPDWYSYKYALQANNEMIEFLQDGINFLKEKQEEEVNDQTL